MNEAPGGPAAPVTTPEYPLPPSWVDRVGAGVSVACAVHCLAAPLLVASFPLVGLRFRLDDTIETILIVTSLLFAGYSFCWGFRVHRRRRVLFALGAAVTLIAGGWFFAAERYELLFVAGGAMLLAASHFLNRHLCRTCTHCSRP